MLKTRGFEKVSLEQFANSIKDISMTETTLNKLYDSIKLPKRATKLSAGYDCYAPYGFTLHPGEEIKISTGIKSYMQPGEVLLALPRSGLGFKYFCRLANTIGVIDADYIESDNEGHIFVKLRNEGDKEMRINAGDAMCQFIFIPFLLIDGDSFDNGSQRNGGFGSTN